MFADPLQTSHASLFLNCYKTITVWIVLLRFAHFWQGAESIASATKKTTVQRPKVVRTFGVFPFSLWNMLWATAASTFSTSQRPKVVRDRQYMSVLCLIVFNTFDCETHFTPQQRALFRQLNFQKCSKAEVLVSTSTSASRHNCVQFLICHPTRWLHTRRFSDYLFARFGLLSSDSSSSLTSSLLYLLSVSPRDSLVWLLLS